MTVSVPHGETADGSAAGEHQKSSLCPLFPLTVQTATASFYLRLICRLFTLYIKGSKMHLLLSLQTRLSAARPLCRCIWKRGHAPSEPAGLHPRPAMSSKSHTHTHRYTHMQSASPVVESIKKTGSVWERENINRTRASYCLHSTSLCLQAQQLLQPCAAQYRVIYSHTVMICRYYLSLKKKKGEYKPQTPSLRRLSDYTLGILINSS